MVPTAVARLVRARDGGIVKIFLEGDAGIVHVANGASRVVCDTLTSDAHAGIPSIEGRCGWLECHGDVAVEDELRGWSKVRRVWLSKQSTCEKRVGWVMLL